MTSITNKPLQKLIERLLTSFLKIFPKIFQRGTNSMRISTPSDHINFNLYLLIIFLQIYYNVDRGGTSLNISFDITDVPAPGTCPDDKVEVCVVIKRKEARPPPITLRIEATGPVENRST